MSSQNTIVNIIRYPASIFPAAVILISLITTSCTSQQNMVEQEETGGETAVQTEKSEPLLNTDWKATSILGRSAGSADSTLSFMTDGNVAGNGGCNAYQGGVTVQSNTIEFGPLAATRMMCSPSISGQETVFLEALGMARAWQLSSKTLELVDENNEVVLQFSQQ